MMFCGCACGFEKVDVLDSCGTCGLAGEAAEAVGHFIGEGRIRHELPFCDSAHERDASARAVLLAMRGVVGWADGETHPAVHALLEHCGVEV